MNITQQRIAVLGCGRSGIAAANLALAKGAAEVCLFDTSPKATYTHPEITCVSAATTEDAALYAADLVLISPGVEPNNAWVTAFCEPKNAPLLGETEFAYRYFEGQIIAITGTNGKTTTTALIEHILLSAGRSAIACGNFGIPLSEVILQHPEKNIAVLEVSSFQMETIEQFCPDIAIWLNFAPDHMDRYKKIEDYFDAKKRIFDNMRPDQLAILRLEEKLGDLAPRIETFSSLESTATLHYKDSVIYEGTRPCLSLKNTRMEQSHNAENSMAALLACRPLGISESQIERAIKSFAPPCHRCEMVAEHKGILWLNDSKSTNLHSTAAAIHSQTRPIILIAGGKQKGLNYAPLIPLLKQKARHCLCFGEIASPLHACLSAACASEKHETIEQCVARALTLVESGDVVLFSPATSSFDQFTGYEARGQCFRDAVHQAIRS